MGRKLRWRLAVAEQIAQWRNQTADDAVVAVAKCFTISARPQHFRRVEKIVDFAFATENLFGDARPEGHFAAEDPRVLDAFFEAREVAGIEVADEHGEAFLRQIFLDVFSKMEIPDEIHHDDVLRYAVDGGDGLVGTGGLQHVAPNHHLEAFFGQMVVDAHDVVVVQIGGILFAADGADADLVDFVMTRMDVFRRSGDFDDFVHQIEQDFV